MLVNCRECEKKISSESKTCIHCSCPTPYKKVKPYIDPSMQYGYFLGLVFQDWIANILGWLFGVSCLIMLSDSRSELLYNNYYLFYFLSAFCGCYYATHYLYYKKFWYPKKPTTYYSWSGEKGYTRIDNWVVHIFYLIGSLVFFFILAVLILLWFVYLLK
jgi:hypothetical protein